MKYYLILIFLLIGCTTMVETNQKLSKSNTAVFAGGCFWCTESDYEKLAGVSKVISGYA